MNYAAAIAADDMVAADPTDDPAYRLFQHRFGALRRARRTETLLTVLIVILLFLAAAAWTDFLPDRIAAGLPRIGEYFGKLFTIEPARGAEPVPVLAWLHLFGGVKQPQSFAWQNRTYQLALRSERHYRPFSIKLLTFSHDIYKGTDIPKNFASRILLQHPETGEKVLFVNAFTTHFVNWHTPENVRYGQDANPGGNDLLRYLVSQAFNPEFHVRWRWKPHSVAIWDNRCTQHYAVMDYAPCHRKMERAAIVGDKPF